MSVNNNLDANDLFKHAFDEILELIEELETTYNKLVTMKVFDIIGEINNGEFIVNDLKISSIHREYNEQNKMYKIILAPSKLDKDTHHSLILTPQDSECLQTIEKIYNQLLITLKCERLNYLFKDIWVKIYHKDPKFFEVKDEISNTLGFIPAKLSFEKLQRTVTKLQENKHKINSEIKLKQHDNKNITKEEYLNYKKCENEAKQLELPENQGLNITEINQKNKIRDLIIPLANDLLLNKDIYKLTTKHYILSSIINELELFGISPTRIESVHYEFDTIKVNKINVSNGKKDIFFENSIIFDIELMSEEDKSFIKQQICIDLTNSEFQIISDFINVINGAYYFDEKTILDKIYELKQKNRNNISMQLKKRINDLKKCTVLKISNMELCKDLINFYEEKLNMITKENFHIIERNY